MCIVILWTTKLYHLSTDYRKDVLETYHWKWPIIAEPNPIMYIDKWLVSPIRTINEVNYSRVTGYNVFILLSASYLSLIGVFTRPTCVVRAEDRSKIGY